MIDKTMENRRRKTPIKELTWFFKIIAILAIGFVGGVISPFFLSWIREINKPGLTDAVSVANTFIIFTTLIFVGFTVILGVAGYIFTQQFATAKELQIRHLISELEEMLRKGDSFGVTFIEQSMKNPDVVRRLETVLEEKVKSLILEENHVKQKEAEEFKNLADRINPSTR